MHLGARTDIQFLTEKPLQNHALLISVHTPEFKGDEAKASLAELARLTGNKEVVKVLDRTGIFIDIFSHYARTRTARLLVEIARLNYLALRLRESTSGNK